MKLSKPQLETLKWTIRNEGRLTRCSITTQGILLSYGLIEKAHRYRTSTERTTLECDRDQLLNEARLLLAENHWKDCLSKLQEADHKDRCLDATCYWITDPGRKAVE